MSISAQPKQFVFNHLPPKRTQKSAARAKISIILLRLCFALGLPLLFEILFSLKMRIKARLLQIATGASAKFLGLEKERQFLGRGLSVCAACDGAFFQEQDVAVVGGGDVAIEEALFSTRFATQVYVIHHRDTLRASKIMQERAFANKKLTFVWETKVENLLGSNEIEGLVLRNVDTGELFHLSVKGLFVAIGYLPNTEIFKGWLEMDQRGYILTHPGSTHTSVNGVFACGDVQDSVYRQAITAAGSGCMAALDVEHWLSNFGSR